MPPVTVDEGASEAGAGGVSPGRGVLYLSLAKLCFMLAGYAVAFGLPRLLGSVELYGRFGVVNRAVAVLNMVMIGGTIQAVSRFVAADVAQAGAVTRLALRLQVVLGLVVAGAYALAAPLTASALGDRSLAPLIQLSAAIVAAYAVYAALVGSLNGRRLFHRQAALDVTFSTTKAALMLGAAALGWGVLGAIGGFAATAVLILAPAGLLLGRLPAGGRASLRDLVGFQVPIFGYTLVLYLLLGLDLFAVKALTAGGAAAADHQAGLYTAVQYLGQLPYTAIVAVTFVVFPMISRATFVQDLEATRRYIRTTLRYTVIVVALLSALISADAPATIAFFYAPEYLTGAPALRLLALGMLALALLVIVATILSGSGRPLTSLLVMSGGLGLSAVGNWLLVPRLGLTGAALATSLAALVTLLLAGALLWHHFRAVVPWPTVARVGLAAGAVWALALWLPVEGRLPLALKWTGLGLLYLGLLAGSRELTRRDLQEVTASLGGDNTGAAE